MFCDLIVKGKYILPMDEELTVVKNGFVAVADAKITAVGEQAQLANWQTKETIDAGHAIIMPGLVNTHTHAGMTYFRGLADDLPLDKWLREHIWPAEAKYVKPDFIAPAMELACLEMITSGTTCFNDMYFFEEAAAAVIKRAGLRAALGEGILNFPTPSCQTPEQALLKSKDLINKYANDELIKFSLAPHSVYACNGKILEEISELSSRFNLLIHIHLSETKQELEDCQKEHGKTPVEYLDRLGLLSPKVIAAHSVWLNDNDLDLYQDRGVKVSHCPMSNMKLAAGIALLPKIMARGITMGLGTDSAASNNTLDLFSDMRTCALLHKVNCLEPTNATSRQVVKMATLDGARVLGLEDKIGSLEAGKRADIITINLNKPHLAPIYDPYSHLVYCANGQDVDNVIINGKIIMRNKKVLTLDQEKIVEQAVNFRFG